MVSGNGGRVTGQSLLLTLRSDERELGLPIARRFAIQSGHRSLEPNASCVKRSATVTGAGSYQITAHWA